MATRRYVDAMPRIHTLSARTQPPAPVPRCSFGRALAGAATLGIALFALTAIRASIVPGGLGAVAWAANAGVSLLVAWLSYAAMRSQVSPAVPGGRPARPAPVADER